MEYPLIPDCFISYSSYDSDFARSVCEELQGHGLSVFMASASLKPGEHWTSETQRNLTQSNWVIVLASRAACASAYVNQEVGAALMGAKTVVPIVWDMPQAELPGWLQDVQALDLRGSSIEQLQAQVGSIAGWIKQDQNKGLIIIGILILGLLWEAEIEHLSTCGGSDSKGTACYGGL